MAACRVCNDVAGLLPHEKCWFRHWMKPYTHSWKRVCCSSHRWCKTRSSRVHSTLHLAIRRCPLASSANTVCRLSQPRVRTHNKRSPSDFACDVTVFCHAVKLRNCVVFVLLNTADCVIFCCINDDSSEPPGVKIIICTICVM